MFNLPKIEQEILSFWKTKDIFKKSLDKKSPKGGFVFYEGPPTANGKPGIHHVLARAFKDLIPRYKTMQGYHVERKAGWDTHGLPVELEVEKKLKLKDKKDVEDYGMEKFNKECKSSVWKYKEDWEKMTERIGFWIDMENPYITYENDYIESLWWIIKQAYQKNLLYKGHKVIPQCPRCGTALSSHEVAQGYKNIQEESVYIKFRLSASALRSFNPIASTGKKPLRATADKLQSIKDDVYILAWTTTPWTLPGNVALAVGEKVDYALIKATILDQGIGRDKNGKLPYIKQHYEYYILAKSLIDTVFKVGGIFKDIKIKDIEIVKKFKGKELIGLEYEPLFPGVITDDIENAKNAYKVYPADFVSTEEGAGVVHTAVMYGQDDYELGEKVGLPKVHTVDIEGKFNELVPQWKGKFVKDVEKEITADLEKRGLLFDKQPNKHDYPFCWRCDTPLLYYAKDSWYFKMSALRDKLLKNNSKINWVPEHIKQGRFGEWLREVKDWAISRERYWGTPIPVWRCQTGKSEILNPKSETNSKFKIQNSKDGCGNMKVIGSVEELEKLSGKKLKDLHRPYIDEITFKCDKCTHSASSGSSSGIMHRIPEVMDCWFDSGAMPFAQYHYPFEGNADKRGSSRLPKRGSNAEINILYPADFIAEAIDQTRGWFYTLLAIATMLDKGTPYKNVICTGHILDKKGQKMSKHLGNVVEPDKVINKYGADVLRWYLYTINQVGEPKKFNEQALKESGRAFVTLFNVLAFYKIFVEHANSDANKYEYHANDFANIKNVLDKWIAAKLNLLIKQVSENLDKYDIFSSARKVEEFINDLSVWYVRRSRDRFKSDNEEDKKQAIFTLGKVLFELSKLIAPFVPFTAEYIYQELGKECKCLKESVHLEEWPKVTEKLIDKKILDYMAITRKVVEMGLAKRAEAGIKVRQPLLELRIKNYELGDEYIKLIKDEVNVKEVVCKKGKGKLAVELSLEISPEMRQEGLLRELVRTINDMRKKQGLTIQDRIKIEYGTSDKESKTVFEKYKAELLKQTLADELVEGEGGLEKMSVNGKEISLKIRNQK